MEKNIQINGETISVNVYDKKLKNTLVCLHGFASDKNFIGDLDSHIDNFNIVSISYNNVSKMNVDFIDKIIQKIVKKHIKHTKIYVLGHSLGAYFASQVANNQKIKGIYLLNPFYPEIYTTSGFKTLEKLITPKTKLGASSVNLLIKALKVQGSPFVKFLDKQSPWYETIQDLVKSKDQMKANLFKSHEQNKDKTWFILSSKDNIISRTNLLQYINKNNYKYQNINFIGHSPLKEHSILIAPILYNVKSKRRIFFKNIIK